MIIVKIVDVHVPSFLVIIMRGINDSVSLTRSLDTSIPPVGSYNVSAGLSGSGYSFVKSQRWKDGCSPPLGN